jgi:ferrous iron transport protein B
MAESKIHFYPKEPLVALVGNPNSGKTSLFNLLTGGKQKVANYAGVTVERKEGRLDFGDRTLRILDLPGVYSLYPRSLDEQITCNVLQGRAIGEKKPDLVLCVLDATNLRRNLRLVLAVKRMGIPCVVVVNMMDLAQKRGIQIDLSQLEQELNLPIVDSIGNQSKGDVAVREKLKAINFSKISADQQFSKEQDEKSEQPYTVETDNVVVQGILYKMGLDKILPDPISDRIDRTLLHPVFGPIILVAVLFFIFQAVFSWAELPMSLIEKSTDWVSQYILESMPTHWIRSLIVYGVIAGLGGVLIFLPQILILFFFILILEESGYLPRAAYLLDRIMGSVGLSGRSFIPLLSSFACAIPGIMATRTITNARDRIVTILIAPLMTCSARLPVYALLIGAFIPARQIGFGIELQGLVLFILYIAGIVGAMCVAWILKKLTSSKKAFHPLMMELPSYHLPSIKNVAIGLWQRMIVFLHRVGGTILVLTIVLWFLASYPSSPEGAIGPAIEYSFAGILGKALAVIFAPIGFNWEISIALVPGLAAREVVVSSLGTVYALAGQANNSAEALTPLLQQGWSLATALSLLAWFVFAPQCLSTIAVVKRETGGYKIPLIMLTYLFALAYLAAFITYRIATHYGLA